MENQLIKEAIQVLKEQKRPVQIQGVLQGQYTNEVQEYMYIDSEEQYTIQRKTPDRKKVRSVKAFATLIKEELKRRENKTGYKATVKLNLEGGEFIADDNYGNGIAEFSRLNSQQWNLVKRSINKDYNHKQFLMLIQALKPSIVNFQETYQRLATLRMVGNTTITSNPIFTENGQQSGYTCRYRLEDGCDGEETFPSGFLLNVPFAKGGDLAYEIPIDLLFYRNDDDELCIELLCPEFENIEEHAILDEAQFVQETLADANELLILSDF